MNRNLKVGIFTAVEDAALVGWLALVRAGQRLLGVLVLPVGFFVEHVIAYNVKRNQPLLSFKGLPSGKILVNAVLETGVWVAWLALWPVNPVVASGFLVLALVVEHSLTDNIFHGRPLTTNLFNTRTIDFSLVEWAGATSWLALVDLGAAYWGVVALVVAQFVEHKLALALAEK